MRENNSRHQDAWLLFANNHVSVARSTSPSRLDIARQEDASMRKEALALIVLTLGLFAWMAVATPQADGG